MSGLGIEEDSLGLLSQEYSNFKTESHGDMFKRPTHGTLLRMIRTYTPRLIDLVKRFLLFLVPSFLSARLVQPAGRQLETVPLRSTAYLDGLRGLAAWSVFNSHLSALLTKTSGAAYGHEGDNTQLYKLPIVRLIYDGDFAVALFFMISGFVLSLGTLSAMKEVPRNGDKAMRKLAGSILRRPVRLYFPAWASMLVAFLLIRFDVFGFLVARQIEFEEYIWGWPVVDEWPVRASSFSAQLVDLVKSCVNLLEIFKILTDADFGVRYNGVLWTIKLEFRSSFILYLTHAALFFMRKPFRLAIVCGLIVMGIALWSFDFPLFWFGYLLAELHVHKLSSNESKQSRHMLRSYSKSLAYWLLIILGGLLGSFPVWDAAKTVHYAWLIPYTPFHFLPYERFWSGLGAAIVVVCIPKLPLMMKIYESGVVQYLGKISYGFYLVHYWMVHIFGTVIFYNIWSITGKNSTIPTAIGFVIAYAMLLACTVGVADVFWRCVDKPSVAFAARFERLMFQDA